jgi:hypothetical protein
VWTDEETVAAGHSIEPARWRDAFEGLMGRIAGRFARVEPRRRAARLVLGPLADLPRKNCWTIAEWAGETTPDGMQHLSGRAKWDADQVRDDVCGYPEPATRTVARFLDAGHQAAWVAGDEVYGGNPKLRTALEERGTGYVLAVACSHEVTTGAGKFRADILAKKVPKRVWQKLSARAGAKGHRVYNWAVIDLPDPRPGSRQLLIRRNRSTGELAYYRCCSPASVPLTVLVALAAVLHDRAGGAMPVADEGVIVDQPGRRPQHPVGTGRQTPHHLAVVPGGPGDEVTQVLPGGAQSLRHRFHRLAPAVRHQPAQVLPTVTTVACVGQVREDIVRELGEVRVQFLNRLSLHPPAVLATDMVKQLLRELIEDHDQALFEGIGTMAGSTVLKRKTVACWIINLEHETHWWEP